MKIAIITPDLTISGGTQRQILELANYLSYKGHKIKLYCFKLDKKNCYPELIKNLNIYSLNNLSRNKLKKVIIPWSFLEKPKQIVNIMDKDFDIINLHDKNAYIIGSLYKKKFNKRVTLIYNMNDLPGIFRKNKNKLKTLIFYLKGGIFEKLLCKKYLSDMDSIVVLDKINYNLLKERTGLNSVIIRSGLAIDKFLFKKRKSPKNRFIILSVGIFFPHRRLEDIAYAIYELRKYGYNVIWKHIGSDSRSQSYARKIYDLVEGLNLANFVDFMGRVSEEQLIEEYSNADVFVFPNSPQTWGLAVFEAMASGTPVIVSTNTGASEVLTDEENALLVYPGRPDLIVKKIKLLINHNESWKKLGVNGRKFVEKNIRWDIYGKKMENLFLKSNKKGGKK